MKNNKKTTKITINELRSIVRSVLKEEFGGPVFIGDLIANGNGQVTFYQTDHTYNIFDKTGAKIRKPINRLPKTGYGKIVFNTDIPAGKFFINKTNTKPFDVPIKKGYYMDVALEKDGTGIFVGDLYQGKVQGQSVGSQEGFSEDKHIKEVMSSHYA